MIRKILFGMGLFISGLIAVDLTSFDVMIYPEYYFPGVMVEFNGKVAEGKIPDKIAIMVPATTDSIFFLLEGEGQKAELLPIDPVDRNGEKWVILDLNQQEFRLFAFYSPFNLQSPDREFSYSLKLDQDLADVHFIIQQPLKALGFEISEKDIETFNDRHGVTFHRAHISHLPSGQEKIITINYRNPSGMLTIDALQTMLGGSSGEKTAGSSAVPPPKRHRLPFWEPLVVLGLLSIVIGYVYMKKRKQTEDQPMKRFCTQCGTAVKPEDKFCANCGRKI